jgi:predicted Zn-dependent peptidase
MKHIYKKLPNGLNVFLLPLKDAESVTVTVLTHVGSRYEDPNKAGMSHYLEHVFFKGSKKYPTAQILSEAVDAIGGDWNAMTSKETTEFYIRAAKQNFDKVFEILTDMLQNPLFDRAELEREKGPIIEEMKMYFDNPAHQVEVNLDKTMWAGSLLGGEIAGSEKTLKSITREDILSFLNKWYVPENMVFGVAGNFNTSEVMKKIQKAWGSLPKAKTPKMPRTAIPSPTELRNRCKTLFAFEKRPIEQTNISIGFQSYGFKDKRLPVLSVLSAILGGGASSRLFIKVREQLGLAYSVYASNDFYQGVGMFTINAGVRSESADAALKAINIELKDLVKNGASQTELNRVKEQLKGRIAIRLEDSQSKLDFLISRFVNSGDFRTPEGVMKAIDAVTLKQVHEVASEIFNPKKMVVSVIGPMKQSPEAIKKVAKF